MAPSAAAGALLIFMTAFNELTVSVLLWSTGHETLGVAVFFLHYEGNSPAAAAVAVISISPPPMHHADGHGIRETVRQVREGLAFVGRYPWLWATLVGALLSLLVFFGPVETLLPYLVKNTMHGSPTMLGIVLGFGGLGAVLAAALMAQRGVPRRNMTFIYITWTIATVAVAAVMASSGMLDSL